MNWYYESAGQQQGPISDTQLDQLVAEGKVTPATLVWHEGMGNWTPLRDARPAVPPGIPGMPSTSPLPAGDTVICESCGKSTPRSEIIQIGNRNICAACKPAVLQKIQQGTELTSATDANRTGPAWEQRESLGTFPAALQTMKAALLEPTETFRNMRLEGGLGTPFLYHLLVGGIGSSCLAIYTTIIQFLTHSFPGMTSDTSAPYQIGIVFGVVLRSIIFAAIGIFINSGIIHVCLMMCGGARKPFEATFRAVSYGASSVAGLHVIPIIGTIAAIPWSIIVGSIALARAHETDTWRGVVAILLPGVVCCGLIVLVALAVVGVVSAAHGVH